MIKIRIWPLILFILLIGIGCSTGTKNISKSTDNYATVNGEPITRAEFDLRVSKMNVVNEALGKSVDKVTLEKEVLENLINEKITLQAAKNQGINLSEQKAREQLEAVKKNFQNKEDWEALLKSRHLNEEDMVKYYHNQMINEELIVKLGGRTQYDQYIKELRSKAKVKVIQNT